MGLKIIIVTLIATTVSMASYAIYDASQVYDCEHYGETRRENVPAKCFSDFIPTQKDSGVK
jgi:cell division protein FtsL